jgi:TatD DNase family protein
VADLIDTHAHLDDEQFQSDLLDVLDRAGAAGVVGIVTIATTATSSLASLALAERSPLLRASAGIHPNSAAAAAPGDWDTITTLAADSRVIGIGETGLDRHWDTTPFAIQEDYFARHLRLARAVGKPVIIHCREAEPDILRALREEHDSSGPIHGVMHSFTGGREMAEASLAMGLHISFAGMLTYKNAAALREVAAKVPLERLLVETDSPYLAPVPMRGRRNEPAFVVHTATCLATLHGLGLEELAAQTTANARRLFGLGEKGRSGGQ